MLGTYELRRQRQPVRLKQMTAVLRKGIPSLNSRTSQDAPSELIPPTAHETSTETRKQTWISEQKQQPHGGRFSTHILLEMLSGFITHGGRSMEDGTALIVPVQYLSEFTTASKTLITHSLVLNLTMIVDWADLDSHAELTKCVTRLSSFHLRTDVMNSEGGHRTFLVHYCRKCKTWLKATFQSTLFPIPNFWCEILKPQRRVGRDVGY